MDTEEFIVKRLLPRFEMIEYRLTKLENKGKNMNETIIKVVDSTEAPLAPDERAVTIEQAKQAIVNALNGGADTVVISEEHSEDTAEEIA